jgi:hypothetical protein
LPAENHNFNHSNVPSVRDPRRQNDDHNPQRVAPRNLFDLAMGVDNVFKTDRYKWSAQVNIINLTNKTALYNFLSTFSGTHYVTPRAITAEIGFHF